MNNLPAINDFIIKNYQDIDAWIVSEYSYKNRSIPIYTSIDIRLSEFKISHVDANLFPAGFNNISLAGRRNAVLMLQRYLKINFPTSTKVLIIMENFTRNAKYLENLKSLKNIFEESHVETIVGSPFFEDDLFDKITGLEIKLVIRTKNILTLTNNWQPDLIVLNNDLTEGFPEILRDLAQPIVPNPDLGWHSRSKNKHFMVFDKILNNFCTTWGIDPWLLSAYHEYCTLVDFKNKEGLECLVNSAATIIDKINIKYKEYNIKEEPYIFIKADQGTYGMGIMHIRNPEDILAINKRNRHSMDVIKSGIHNTKVIIQEGVPTAESTEGNPSETLAYLIAGETIDMFMRSNKTKDKYSNLNSRDMWFDSNANSGAFYFKELKTIIARLAAISIAFES
jgi:glutamate--cysteine ligase